jgi:hypothetical protein
VICQTTDWFWVMFIIFATLLVWAVVKAVFWFIVDLIGDEAQP